MTYPARGPTHERRSEAGGTYLRFGLLGVASGTASALWIGGRVGLHPVDVALAIALALLGNLALALGRATWSGTESYAHQHLLMVVLSAAIAAARLTGAPASALLDTLLPGFALLTAAGRIGCFRVGCCHGRPSRRGWRASMERPLLPRCLAGARLVPVQLMESGWLVGVALAGGWLAVGGARPGTAAVTVLAAMAAGRFGLELLRGDVGRKAAAGLFEAQWIAAGLGTTLLVGGALGLVPLTPVAAALACIPPAWALALLAQRRTSSNQPSRVAPRLALLLAELLAAHPESPNPSSQGDADPSAWARPPFRANELRLSLSRVPTEGGPAALLTLSGAAGPLGPRFAQDLADTLAGLEPLVRGVRLLAGTQAGIWHALCALPPLPRYDL